MKTLLAFLLLATVAAYANSVDLGTFTWKGETYQHASATMTSSDKIQILHDSGLFVIPWDEANATLQFKLKPERETLIASATQNTKTTVPIESRATDSSSGETVLYAIVTQVIDGGIICEASLLSKEQQAKVQSSLQQHRQWGEANPEVNELNFGKKLGTIFLKGSFPDLVDGAKWKGKAVPDGRFQFVTVLGAQRTIPQWAAQQ